jgi:hypothetical protein
MIRRTLLVLAIAVVACAVAAAWRQDALGRFHEAWSSTASFAYGNPVEHVRASLAYLDGKEQAARDVRAGRLVVQTYGLPSRAAPVYRELLKARLGVDEYVVGGCMTTPAQEGSSAGYNVFMEQEITRRFGRDALEKVLVEAHALTRQRYECGELR